MSTTDMKALERLISMQHKTQLEYIEALENTILDMAQTALDIGVPTGANSDAVSWLIEKTQNTKVLWDARELLNKLDGDD